MATARLVDRLKQEVESNLQNEQFGVTELAKSVGMSRSNLHRKLQEKTGQSVSQFIREYRLERGREILISEDANVSEVAYRVGFNSSSYFSKTFTEYFGYPPVEAKRRQTTSEIPIKEKKYKAWVIVVTLAAIAILAGLYLLDNGSDPAVPGPAGPVSIAVIPFKNLNQDQSNQYFADGVMEAILNKLSQVGQLRVTSRTSVEQFRNTHKTIPDIGRELNVQYILEGSAQKDGDQIRLVSQLVEVGPDAHILWSQDYTEPFENVLGLQNQIAEKVTEQLRLALSIEEQEELQAIPTANPEAYNKFLMARFQHYRYTKESLQDAIKLFEEVIAIDPQFAEAYLNLAQIWVVNGAVWGIADQDSAWAQAKQLLYTTLQLDPENAMAYETLATGYFWYEWDMELAEKYFDKVLEIQGHAGDWTTGYYLKVGQPQKALELSSYYIEKNPLDSWNYYYHAEALNLSGQTDQALQVADKAFHRFDDFLLKRECVKLFFLAGAHEIFIRSYEDLQKEFPDRPPLMIWMGAMHANLTGQDITPFIENLEQLYKQNSSGSPAWFLALTYAALKDEKNLFHWLERSYERKEVEMTWLKSEPALDAYKKHPQYQELLRRVGFS